MKTEEAKRQLATPPAPNPLGQDRFQITETKYFQHNPPNGHPVKIVHTGKWQAF